MLDLVDVSGLGPLTQELNQVYQQTAALHGVPRASLLAIGADAETISSISSSVEGNLYIAMDNCPHQTVVVGEEQAIAQATEQLRQRGLIYERLPFDRPYHTPLFEPFADPLRALFERWIVAPPRARLYSCTTMAPFPADVAQIRDVAVQHWMRPVEFRKTVEAMHADGVRIFVEVGPRGNLSSFVGDILRGRSHLAVPANMAGRSGISQLNHVVGLLAAHGIPMQLEYLYMRRSPRKLSLDSGAAAEAGDQAPKGRMKLITGWPAMNIPQETLARLRSREQAAPASAPLPVAPSANGAYHGAEVAPQRANGAAPPASQMPAVPPLQPAVTPPATNGHAAAPTPSLPPAHMRHSSAAQVMSAHFQTMEQLLAMQQEIMQSYLAGAAAAPLASNPPVAQIEYESASSGAALLATVSSAEPLPDAPIAVQEQIAAAHPIRLDAAAIRDLLLQLISDRTGYPLEMLDLNLDMEADLGIDSIKRVEILGLLHKQTNLLQAEDLETLATRKTLREVIDFLASLDGAGERQQIAPAMLASPTVEAHQQITALAPASKAKAAPLRPGPLSAEAVSLPLIETIVSLAPGEELLALRELRLEEDVFLRDHTFGYDVSVTDASLIGLPVLPLTVSMEMLAEAAAVLMPGKRLIEMRDIRAYRWVALDKDRLTLQLVARRTPDAQGYAVAAQMFEAEAAGAPRGPAATPIIEGLMVFGETYPGPPAPGDFTLRDERPASWTPERLYEDSLMFHGASFRGVVSMDGWCDNGARATLQALPADRLFRSNPRPAFVTDPVLLDQVGQVVGFWGLERLEPSIVMFPFRVESIRFYGPNPRAHQRLRCHTRTALIGERQVRADIEVLGADGQVWLRVVGWEDRCFELPHPFRDFMFSSPREVKLSKPWPIPADSPPGAAGLRVYRLGVNDFSKGFFTAHSGIWRRALARQILSRRERELWHSLSLPEPRRVEWLIGRGVAKDAVRHYLEDHYGLQLCPADIEILPDEHGRPTIGGAWLDQVPPDELPLLSIAHAGGVAVAVVGERADGAGIGIDLEPLGRMQAETEAIAFTPNELALLSPLRADAHDDWPLRLWCAKEAVSKAIGQGLADGPRALVVQAVDAPSATVQVGVTPELARRAGIADSHAVTAWTNCEENLVVSIALYEADRREARP